MNEITKCFETSPLSLPVFIHLGFDRYGWIPLPADILSEYFDQIVEGQGLLNYYQAQFNVKPLSEQVVARFQMQNQKKLIYLGQPSFMMKTHCQVLTNLEVWTKFQTGKLSSRPYEKQFSVIQLGCPELIKFDYELCLYLE